MTSAIATAVGPADLARTPPFTLAGVEVRPATRQVIEPGGRARVLEPRVLQVLVALARRCGEVVARDELLAACWGGRIVGDDALTRCVAALRRLAPGWGGVSIATVARVGYRLETTAEPPARPPPPQPAAAPRLAVLPFEILSGEAEMAYLSDGVCEEILQAVAQRTPLKVIARAASAPFRGADKVVHRVAEELRATHVLDGSVRRSGALVRVSAHLIECAGQTILWSDHFERELGDLFALQDAVAAAVAGALRRALGQPAVS